MTVRADVPEKKTRSTGWQPGDLVYVGFLSTIRILRKVMRKRPHSAGIEFALRQPGGDRKSRSTFAASSAVGFSFATCLMSGQRLVLRVVKSAYVLAHAKLRIMARMLNVIR